jgi:hypothetical protein
MKACQLVGLCLIAALSGCGGPGPSPLNGHVGQDCDVQFRRDALGAATPNGISPETGEYNGSVVHMLGTLKKAQADAIVISDGQSEYVIPMHAILYVKFAEARKK